MRKLAGLLLIGLCSPALGQEMEPGQWEFTTTMSMPGMPQPQTMTNARCITKADSDPSRWADKQQGDCKVSPSRKSGGTYTWDVSCPSSGMRGTGTARVTRSTVESELRLAGDMGGQKFEMLNKTTGKRLGACQK
jgi:uncharacterized protein DUF3617